MQLVSRTTAERLRLKYYFTGVQCSNGHIAQRRTRSGACTECQRVWCRKYYWQDPEAARARVKRDHAGRRDESNKRRRAEYAKNRDAIRAECRRLYAVNKKQISEARKQKRLLNLKAIRERELRWAERNREKLRKRKLDRWLANYSSDPSFRLAHVLRSRLYDALNNRRAGSAIRDLGCSVDTLKRYIEDRFVPPMTWENWGDVWEIDHIKPLCSFNLTKRKQFLAAAHYSNLQPLLLTDHKEKTRHDRALSISPQ